jgi:hypothetical protein
MKAENGMTATPVQAIVMPCLFCGCGDVDPRGWANSKGDTGPQCIQCGATAESIAIWNNREWVIDRITNSIDEAIRKNTCATYSDWQSLVASVLSSVEKRDAG